VELYLITEKLYFYSMEYLTQLIVG